MNTTQFLSELLWWTGLFVLCFALLVWVLDWFASKLIDAIWPPSAEEISRLEAERVAKQATKEFKKRQRLRTVRFWSL